MVQAPGSWPAISEGGFVFIRDVLGQVKGGKIGALDGGVLILHVDFNKA